MGLFGCYGVNQYPKICMKKLLYNSGDRKGSPKEFHIIQTTPKHSWEKGEFLSVYLAEKRVNLSCAAILLFIYMRYIMWNYLFLTQPSQFCMFSTLVVQFSIHHHISIHSDLWDHRLGSTSPSSYPLHTFHAILVCRTCADGIAWMKKGGRTTFHLFQSQCDRHSFVSLTWRRPSHSRSCLHVFFYLNFCSFFVSLDVSLSSLLAARTFNKKKANEIFLHTPGRSKEKKKIYIWKKKYRKERRAAIIMCNFFSFETLYNNTSIK